MKINPNQQLNLKPNFKSSIIQPQSSKDTKEFFIAVQFNKQSPYKKSKQNKNF